MGFGDNTLRFISSAEALLGLPKIPDLDANNLHTYLKPEGFHNSQPLNGNGTLVATHWDPKTGIQAFHLDPSAGHPDSMVAVLRRHGSGAPLQGTVWAGPEHPLATELSVIGDRNELTRLKLQGERFGHISAYFGKRGGQVRVVGSVAPQDAVSMRHRISAFLVDPDIHDKWKEIIRGWQQTHTAPEDAGKLRSLLAHVIPDRWHVEPSGNLVSSLGLRQRRGSASTLLLGIAGVITLGYFAFQNRDNLSGFADRMMAGAKETISKISLSDIVFMMI